MKYTLDRKKEVLVPVNPYQPCTYIERKYFGFSEDRPNNKCWTDFARENPPIPCDPSTFPEDREEYEEREIRFNQWQCNSFGVWGECQDKEHAGYMNVRRGLPVRCVAIYSPEEKKEESPVVDKEQLVRGFAELTSKHALELFYMLGLKTHFDADVINDENGDEFVLSFGKTSRLRELQQRFNKLQEAFEALLNEPTCEGQSEEYWRERAGLTSPGNPPA